MAKNTFKRMFEAFAKDAEPEEVLEAAKAVDSACKDEDKSDEQKPQITQDEDLEMVMQAIHDLNEKIEAMQRENAAHHAEEAKDEAPEAEEEVKLTGLDAVEAAIKEKMEAQDSDESDVTVDPEVLNDEEPEEVAEEETKVIESEDEAPKEEEEEEVEVKEKTADRAISLAMLRAIKPIVAAMPKEQRQHATDALSKAVKKAMGTKPSQQLPGGYGSLLKRKATADANIMAAQRAFGENCRKRNPHVKK